MRALIQRVSKASVNIDNDLFSETGEGFLILLGIEEDDKNTDADYLIQKICGLRVFSDSNKKMNFSIRDISGSFLVISQFTLYASTKKGNRPSFIKAANPEKAIPLYEYFVHHLKIISNLTVKTGVFGADMKVALVNDGPVTIMLDSRNRE